MTLNGSAACMSAFSPGAKKEARPAMCSVSVVTGKSLQDIEKVIQSFLSSDVPVHSAQS